MKPYTHILTEVHTSQCFVYVCVCVFLFNMLRL